MKLFNIFNKKRDYSSYVFQIKNLSLLSFAPLTNTFFDYHELQNEENMKIWDAIFPVVLCGYSGYIDNIIEKPKEYYSLKKSLKDEVIQGDELLDDYVSFINSKNTNSEEL